MYDIFIRFHKVCGTIYFLTISKGWLHIRLYINKKMKASAYSKMYLVVPSVYDKVLKNIDEKDKKVLEQLNLEKETNTRPSEQYLEDVANADLDPSITSDVQSDPQPSTSQFIDPVSNEPEQTFGSTDVMADEPQEQAFESGVVLNPLKTDCAQPDVQDKFIPMIQPGLKRSRILKPTLGKIAKPTAMVRQQVYVPSIMKQHPQIQKIQSAEMMQPTKVISSKVVPRNFICKICGKPFKSTWHLNRHLSVHKNVSFQPSMPLPDDDIQMSQQQPFVPQPGTSSQQFQNWQTDTPSTKKGLKRTPTQAKLKYTPRPPKMRPDDSDYDEWK